MALNKRKPEGKEFLLYLSRRDSRSKVGGAEKGKNWGWGKREKATIKRSTNSRG